MKKVLSLFLWVYSENAAVRASASRALKKIRYLGGEVLSRKKQEKGKM